GGGILHTVQATREARDEDLVRTAAERFRSMLAFGTTTIEVKSGYGLRTADELKILHAAAEAGRAAGIDVVRTLLGAHAIPPEFEGQADAYVDLVGGEMVDAVAAGRRLVAAGVPIALGTDFSPNCWCESTQLTIALACHHNGLLPAEAVVAATINAAHATGLGADVGSLEPGKLADLVILGVPSYRHLGYHIARHPPRVVTKRRDAATDGAIR